MKTEAKQEGGDNVKESRYKLCYISMILAYLIVGYLLILSDLIAVYGKEVLNRVLAITAVGLWIVGFWYQEYLDEKKVARRAHLPRR